MRLADQISYIPSDMVDGLRARMIRDENGNLVTQIDEEYRNILVQLGISDEEIGECNTKRAYDDIGEKLKEIFINDLIENSTRQKISMSKEVMGLMIELRNMNYQRCVSGSSLYEDEEIYPECIRKLINRYTNIILQRGLLEKIEEQDQSIYDEMDIYEGTVDENFVKYICDTNIDDFQLTQIIAEEATKNSIGSELEFARNCVLTRKKYEPKQALGNKYHRKNGRIQSYIKFYQEKLASGKMIGYSDSDSAAEQDTIFQNIKSGSSSENCVDMRERIAALMAIKYISTLSDHEFLQLLIDTALVTPEQYKSLTRPYSLINRNKEGYRHNTWIKLQQEQAPEIDGKTEKMR